MSAPFTSDTYNVTSGILAFPDHYVAKAVTVSSSDANAITRGSATVVPAGTVWPSNDADAEGILLNDAFVTNGDVSAAVVIHGFIRSSALPTGASALEADFTGDGSTTDFTLADTPASIESVTVGGTETTAYTLSDNVITFTSAPGNGDAIVVEYTVTGVSAAAQAVLKQITLI